jgi:Uma2 family endonuclease
MSIQVLQPEDNRIELVNGDEPRRVLLEITFPSGKPSAVTRKMTYEEFLAWADEDTLAEWVNGEVVMTSPASDRHQDIADFLTSVMRVYVRVRDLGMVRSAPFQMKLENGREPDLIFVRQENLGRFRETYLDGPADLAIEIISPESETRDRGAKYAEYARGGVSEYWLIDPVEQWADFYQLRQGHYVTVLSGKEGKYVSAQMTGFWLQVEWLWQDPLPSEIQVWAKVLGMDTQIAAAFEQAFKDA